MLPSSTKEAENKKYLPHQLTFGMGKRKSKWKEKNKCHNNDRTTFQENKKRAPLPS